MARISQSLLFVAFAWTCLTALGWSYTVDDAYILGRYALRLSQGLGYTFIDGPPTDGVTGPLWLVPLSLASWMGFDAVVSAKVLGSACGALAVLLVVERARRCEGRVAGWAAAIALLVQPTLVVWSVAGLGTGAATLCCTGAALAASAHPAPRPAIAAPSCAAIVWLRPEAAALALGVVIWTWARDARAGRLVALGLAVGVAMLLAFRLLMFGHWLPLSFHAKPAVLGHGLQYAAWGMLHVTSLAGVVLVWSAARGSRARAMVMLLLLHVVAVVVAGGDWMPGFRLLAPAVALYGLLVGVGADRLMRHKGRALGAALLALGCVVPAIDFAIGLPEIRRSSYTREHQGAELAAWMEKHARTVALVDVGVLMYRRRLECVDLGGLTDPHIAHAPGGYLAKRFDIGYLVERDPDAIVLTTAEQPRVSPEGRLLSPARSPIERRLQRHRWVRAHFRVARVARYNADYYYVVLTRSSAVGVGVGMADPGA